jgi:hypothetical protein
VKGSLRKEKEIKEKIGGTRQNEGECCEKLKKGRF